VAAGLGAAVFGAVRNACLYCVGTRTSHAARQQLFAALLGRPIAFFDRTMTAELAARITSDAQAMTSPIQLDLAIVLGAALGMLGSLAMCLTLDWRLTLLCLTALGPPALLLRAYADWGAAVHGRVWSSLAGANGLAVQALGHIRTVRAAGRWAHAAELRKYAGATDEALRAWNRDALANGGAVLLAQAVDVLALALVLWCTHASAHAGADTEIRLLLLAFPLHWAAASGGFHTMMAYYSGFLRGAAAAQRVFAILDADDTDAGTQSLHMTSHGPRSATASPSSRRTPNSLRTPCGTIWCTGWSRHRTRPPSTGPAGGRTRTTLFWPSGRWATTRRSASAGSG
jgi:ABC-type multidrug transport system fused ATPase/permease subunit